MRRTDDIATPAELAELFGCGPGEPHRPAKDIIPVCDGEWRKEADGNYRFWEEEDD